VISLERVAAVGAAASVMLGLGLGFAALGPPSEQRAEAIDRATLERLLARAPHHAQRRRILCADFLRRSAGSDRWHDVPHAAGHVCFTFAPNTDLPEGTP
jgi:hypothetical protein